MPFPVVYLQDKVSGDEVDKMRCKIVQVLSESMDVPKNWVIPRFPMDFLNDAVDDDDGGNTIFIQLNTMMFQDRPDADELAPRVTKALAQAVSDVINGRYEVECMVPGGKKDWIGLVKANPEAA